MSLAPKPICTLPVLPVMVKITEEPFVNNKHFMVPCKIKEDDIILRYSPPTPKDKGSDDKLPEHELKRIQSKSSKLESYVTN